MTDPHGPYGHPARDPSLPRSSPAAPGPYAPDRWINWGPTVDSFDTSTINTGVHTVVRRPETTERPPPGDGGTDGADGGRGGGPPDDEGGPVESGALSGGGRRRGGFLKDNLSVASGTLLSRVTGVGRLVALYAAAGPSLRDVYLLANNTPNIIYELILGGILTATLVPLFTDHFTHHDDEADSAVVTVAGLSLAVLTVVAAVAAPALMLLYSSNTGPGVDPAAVRSVGIRLSLLFVPQVFFYGVMALGSALLNARRRFFAAAWAPVLNNVVVIAVLFAVRVTYGLPEVSRADGDTGLILILGLGTTSGIVAMAVALWPALRRAGVRLRFRPEWHHPAVRRAVTLSGWTLGYVVANQIAAQVVNVLAEPGSGDVTTYQTAFIFFQLPHGLLAVTLMTTFQPELARSHSRGDDAEFSSRLLLGLRLLTLVVVPAAVGYFVLPRAVLHAQGAASSVGGHAADVFAVGDTLSAFALGLVGFSVYLFVLRAFYARQDTRTPFLLNCVENALNIVFAVALVGRFGVEGLAAGYAIAYTVAAILSTAVLVRRLPRFEVGALVSSLLRTLMAAAVMGAAVLVAGRAVGAGSSVTLAAAVLGSVVVGVVVYAGAAWLLRLPQQTGLVPSRGRLPGGGSADRSRD